MKKKLFYLIPLLISCALLKAHENDIFSSEIISVIKNRAQSNYDNNIINHESPEDNGKSPLNFSTVALNHTGRIGDDCSLNNGTVEINVIANDIDPNENLNPSSLTPLNNSAQPLNSIVSPKQKKDL